MDKRKKIYDYITKTRPCNIQNFWGYKNEKFSVEFFFLIFSYFIFAQNIDCGYTLEPLRRGGSNEYPQSMFWSKNKKKWVYLYIPHFCYIKLGYISRTCFHDVRE